MRVYTAYFETRLSPKQYRMSKSSDIYNYYLVLNLLGCDLVITVNDFKRIDRKVIRL